MLREWRHHPWRHGVALLAVALGVALAWSVHLINDSALAEFSEAVRSANGEPDAVLRGPREGFDDALIERVAATQPWRCASPVVEIDTYAHGRNGQRVALRVLGIDAAGRGLGARAAAACRRTRGPHGRARSRPRLRQRRARQARLAAGDTLALQRARTWRCGWPAAWPPAARRWW